MRFIFSNINNYRYVLDAGQLRNHVVRLNRTPADQLPKVNYTCFTVSALCIFI